MRSDGQPSNDMFQLSSKHDVSLFRHIDETDAKKILTALPWRTGGDHQDDLVLRGWRLSSRTRNPITSPCMKQLTWPRIVHSGDWCLRLGLCSPSDACQKWMNGHVKYNLCFIVQSFLVCCHKWWGSFVVKMSVVIFARVCLRQNKSEWSPAYIWAIETRF